MKFISWNVNGLRAICGKGFDKIFGDFDADAVCISCRQFIPTELQRRSINMER